MTLLHVDGLSSHYGRILALKGLGLRVEEGEVVALVGANGAGKTTLLRCLSGVRPASGGTIRFAGADITRLSAERRVVAGIAQVPEGRQVFAPLTVADNLRLGAYGRRGKDVAADMERLYALFPALAQKRTQPAGILSGGQQQMLAVARALMCRPRLLLLDEPAMGLAPMLVADLFQVVRDLARQGIAILLAEQNAAAALAVADRAYVLETGALAMTGSGAALLADSRVRAAYLGLRDSPSFSHRPGPDPWPEGQDGLIRP